MAPDSNIWLIDVTHEREALEGIGTATSIAALGF